MSSKQKYKYERIVLIVVGCLLIIAFLVIKNDLRTSVQVTRAVTSRDTIYEFEHITVNGRECILLTGYHAAGLSCDWENNTPTPYPTLAFTPRPTQTRIGECDCSPSLTCDDFDYLGAAQLCYERCDKGIASLDPDGDGWACINTPTPESSQ